MKSVAQGFDIIIKWTLFRFIDSAFFNLQVTRHIQVIRISSMVIFISTFYLLSTPMNGNTISRTRKALWYSQSALTVLNNSHLDCSRRSLAMLWRKQTSWSYVMEPCYENESIGHHSIGHLKTLIVIRCIYQWGDETNYCPLSIKEKADCTEIN